MASAALTASAPGPSSLTRSVVEGARMKVKIFQMKLKTAVLGATCLDGVEGGGGGGH